MLDLGFQALDIVENAPNLDVQPHDLGQFVAAALTACKMRRHLSSLVDSQ
jgi:hypothetical protein